MTDLQSNSDSPPIALCPECNDTGKVPVGPHTLSTGKTIDSIYCEWCPHGDALRIMAYFPGKTKTYTLAQWLGDTVKSLHLSQQKGEDVRDAFDGWYEAYCKQQGKRLLH